MSILQFIVDMKWAFMALIVTTVVIVWAWRMPDETREAIRKNLMARGIKASVGSAAVELGAPASTEAVTTASAPDSELETRVETAGPESTQVQVQQLRREAVEQIMRDAAEWGWFMGAQGFQTPPRPVITWQDDQPVITYAMGTPATGSSTGPYVLPGSGA